MTFGILFQKKIPYNFCPIQHTSNITPDYLY